MSAEERTAPGLAFSFPGWESNFGRQQQAQETGVERQLLSDIDDLDDYPDEMDADEAPPEQAAATTSEEDQRTCWLLQVPAHVLMQVLSRLDVKDLLRLSQTCQELHSLSTRNELWQKHSAGRRAVIHQLPALDPLSGLTWLAGTLSKSSVLVRSNRAFARQEQMQALRRKFLEVASGRSDEQAEHCPGVQMYLCRHLRAADMLDAKLLSLWRSHVSMRTALCEMWLGDNIEASWLRCIICQLTRFSWSHCYEALGDAFRQMCDAIALRLLHTQPSVTWQNVLDLWKCFSSWLGRVCTQCELLSQCVSAERTAQWMASGRYHTPSIPHAGAAAFRSQVLLRFGLREKLQDELIDLASSPQHKVLLGRVRAVLAELDVEDDGTANKVYRTQEIYRDAFGLEPGSMRMRMDCSLPRAHF